MEGEYEREDDEEEFFLEPRLILSRDIDRLNFTLNLFQAYGIKEHLGSIQTSFGARYDFNKWWRFGAEHRHDWRTDEGAVMPQIWFVPYGEITLKFGVSIPTGRNEEIFGRFVLEVEF